MSKTHAEYIQTLETDNTLTATAMTRSEYADQLLNLQKNICRLVFGDSYTEDMRVNDAIEKCTKLAQKKGAENNPAVIKGIQAMNTVGAEIGSIRAGLSSEKRIQRKLDELEAAYKKNYNNVYLTDGCDETELDSVVLTDSGILILEVKRVRNDVLLSSDGKMINGRNCIPIREKMERKRNLLGKKLFYEFASKGWDIPVSISSIIVFDSKNPIRVTNDLRTEKYCFSSGLSYRIKDYLGNTYYTAEQLDRIDEVLSELSVPNTKAFNVKIDYSEIREAIAFMLELLQSDPTANSGSNCTPLILNLKKHSARGYLAAGAAAVLFVTVGAFVSGCHKR